MDSHLRTINIKTAAEEVRSFSLPAIATIWQLKEQIGKSFCVNPDSQCLLFHGNLLKDEMPLSEYVKEDNLNICMMVRVVDKSLTLAYLNPAIIFQEMIGFFEEMYYSTDSYHSEDYESYPEEYGDHSEEDDDHSEEDEHYSEEDEHYSEEDEDYTEEDEDYTEENNYYREEYLLFPIITPSNNKKNDSHLKEDDIKQIMWSCGMSKAETVKRLNETTMTLSLH